MTKRKQNRITDWQETAVRELRAAATALPDDLQLVERPRSTDLGLVEVRIRLRTGDLPCAPHGLPLQEQEEFLLIIGPSRLSPPLVEVEHTRFLGYPHVLQGQRLCTYLDPAREWNPQRGFGSAIDRLYEWLADAAAARFNPDMALFHAVGGILHQTPGTPTIVVREPGKPFKAQPAYLTVRSPHRQDLHYSSGHSDQHRTVVFQLTEPLPLGAGTRVRGLLTLLDATIQTSIFAAPPPRPQAAALLTALGAAASRNPAGTPQTFILAIPHPTGGPPHLLAGRLPAAAADELRRQVQNRSSPTIEVSAETLDKYTPVEWCTVSDERNSVTIRRDSNRPTTAYQDKTIQVWGCGGLGSWIAEFIARAGAKRLILCDPGKVVGGLLVRQDFTEDDVGEVKSEALRQRLMAIRDNLAVEAHTGIIPENLATLLGDTDLVIDATISRAIGQLLDELGPLVGRPLLAQVATDAGTSTLGLLTVSGRTQPLGPNAIDEQTGRAVTADGALEPFHTFWKDASDEDELIPTRGCSVPTFHGSAADIAAIAGTLTSLLGLHLASTEPVSGTHLIGLPHSTTGPFRKFIPTM